MKNILVINDNSPEAEHAALFALHIAQKMKRTLLLANALPVEEAGQKVLAGMGGEPVTGQGHETLANLALINETFTGFKPDMVALDVSALDENALVQMIDKSEVSMIVKGMPHKIAASKNGHNLNVILNKVRCPLLLVPETWEIKKIERLAYIADLRFCRALMVNYLAAMAKSCDATLSVAHLSAKGIPDMDENWANKVFKKEVYDRLDYKEVYFNNIREKDLKKALDVIINGMHNDILAFVNHRFHFQELIGRYLTDILPAHITVPLLIFPY